MKEKLQKDHLFQALKEVVDPELGINIVDLGLIYGVKIQNGEVAIQMTMTTPACPLGAYLTNQVSAIIRRHFPQVQSVQVELVWDPPWNPQMMSEAAKKQLGWSKR